jgi:hypothetical protein
VSNRGRFGVCAFARGSAKIASKPFAARDTGSATPSQLASVRDVHGKSRTGFELRRAAVSIATTITRGWTFDSGHVGVERSDVGHSVAPGECRSAGECYARHGDAQANGATRDALVPGEALADHAPQGNECRTADSLVVHARSMTTAVLAVSGE